MTKITKRNFLCLPVLLCIILLSTGVTTSLYSQSDTVSLETINSFPGQWCTANDGYIYGDGLNTREFIFRKRENGQAIEKRADVTTLDPTFRIENRMYGTSTPGLIFVLVKNNKDQHYLLKSSDGGATIKNVFAFGEGNGPGNTNASNVRLLKGLLELGRDVPMGGGKGTLYIGEYNFNNKRVPGSANDRVRIMKSTDNGDTWTKVVEWNTNGANQVGHVHAMVQDPYTGEIYICVGDFDTKLGIIKWDGTSAWADNRTLPQISNMKGFKVFTGKQRYRTCDILFDENFFYTFTDTQGENNPGGVESGIWKAGKDFSSYTRVDNQIYGYDPMHVGWLGAKIGKTFIFTTAREYIDPSNAWKQLNTQVYTSTDGVHWKVTGILGWRDFDDPTLSKYAANVFTYNNKLYIDCYGGAGHSSTIQCKLVANRNPEGGPEVLHPVYFLGKWNADGNDSNSGTNADSPKASLRNLLTGSRISAGSRIKVSPGTFAETGIEADWSVPVFKGRGGVVVDGRGMDSTKFVELGSGGLPAIRIDSLKTFTNSRSPFILKNLEFSFPSAEGTNHRNFVLDIINTCVRTIRCRIGNNGNDDSPLVHLRNSGAVFESDKTEFNTGKKPGIYRTVLLTDGPSSISFTNSLVVNAYNALSINHDSVNFSLRSSTFYSIENSALVLGTNFRRQPVVKNCLLYTGAAPIVNQSVIITNQIDYNYYNKANINVTDGGHGPEVGKNPLFVDSAKGDFRIYANSPCAFDGFFYPDILTDIIGQRRHNPPCIGAFECIDKQAPANDTIPAGNGNGSVPADTIPPGNGSGGNVPADTIPPGTGNGGNIPADTIPPGNGNAGNTTGDNGDSTGIDNGQAGQLKIYPNPVTDFLTIEYPDEDLRSVIILDTNGKMQFRENTSSRSCTLDFTRFRKGMYIVELITSSKAIKRVKIIKD